jgi:hypothetical protein
MSSIGELGRVFETSLGNPKRALTTGVHRFFLFFYVLFAHYIALLRAI